MTRREGSNMKKIFSILLVLGLLLALSACKKDVAPEGPATDDPTPASSEGAEGVEDGTALSGKLAAVDPTAYIDAEVSVAIRNGGSEVYCVESRVKSLGTTAQLSDGLVRMWIREDGTVSDDPEETRFDAWAKDGAVWISTEGGEWYATAPGDEVPFPDVAGLLADVIAFGDSAGATADSGILRYQDVPAGFMPRIADGSAMADFNGAGYTEWAVEAEFTPDGKPSVLLADATPPENPNNDGISIRVTFLSFGGLESLDVPDEILGSVSAPSGGDGEGIIDGSADAE